MQLNLAKHLYKRLCIINNIKLKTCYVEDKNNLSVMILNDVDLGISKIELDKSWPKSSNRF